MSAWWNDLTPARRAWLQTELTDKQLSVLRMRMDNHSWRTIADTLNIHEATCRGHYKAALDRLERKEAA